MALFEGGHSEYTSGKLEVQDLKPDPFELLREWIDLAKQANIVEPTAMTLATATPEGAPSARMVLLRGIDHGLQFFSNYHSRKGHELAQNPQAALCLWWPTLERQIRVEGKVERLSGEESDAYFYGRPKESQAASSASPQSQVISNRESLEALMDEFLSQESIERPDHWGGYRLIPHTIEFWQGRKARLHDRFCYVRTGGDWIIHRLAP